MTSINKYYLFQLLILKSFQSVHCQQEDDIKPEQNNEELYRMLLICFLSACTMLFLFFCLKTYFDYRNRNRPPPGPFDNFLNLKAITVSDLTALQRRLVLEVILEDGGYVKTHKKGGEVTKQCGNCSTDCSGDEECPPIKDEGKNTDEEPPSMPSLHSPEIKSSGKHFLSMNKLKLPPSLKRRPMFSLIPNTSEDEETNVHDEEAKVYDEEAKVYDEVAKVYDEEANVYDSVENGEQHHSTSDIEIPEIKEEAIMTPVISSRKSYENEMKESHCPICLDNYEDGDHIFYSQYCSHYFHKECIEEWLEKNFECPCCRIQMISNDEIGQAISKLMNKDGRGEKKDIEVKPTMTEITPPPSPVSSYEGSPTPPQLS